MPVAGLLGMTAENDFLEVARQLAIEAGRCLMALRQTALVKERKADRSLVTNADRDADRLILTGLRQNFPQHAFLTEESGLEGDPGAEFVWAVDPLDGTKAYARGEAGFSVMIGLWRHGRPHLGVVMDPVENRLYDAVRGGGAHETHSGKRTALQVSKRREWTDMPIVTSTDFPKEFSSKIQENLPCPWRPAINSVGIKVGLLVRQEADLYFNHHAVHYWDTVAPQVILEEAGGVFTLADGQPLVYDLRSQHRHAGPTLASNGQRHTDFIQAIAPLL